MLSELRPSRLAAKRLHLQLQNEDYEMLATVYVNVEKEVHTGRSQVDQLSVTVQTARRAFRVCNSC